jgi:hypothetical protein
MTMDSRELTEAHRVFYEEEIEGMMRRMKIEGGTLEGSFICWPTSFVLRQTGLRRHGRNYFTIPTMKYGRNVKRPLMLSNPTGDGSRKARPRLSDPMHRYTVAELLARSNHLQPQPPEEREWIDAGKSEHVLSVTSRATIRCQYNAAGTIFWRTFLGASCPGKIEVE